MTWTPRPYQVEALDGGRDYPGIYRALEEHGSTVLVLATGCGKTEVFARVVDRVVAKGKRAMVMAHTKDLIGQTFARLAQRTSISPWHLGVEMAGLHAADHHRAIVASVQTLSGEKRLRRFDPSEFGILVADEAHHSLAPTHLRVLEYFAESGCPLLGVTATPHRGDGQGLGQVYRSTAYVYEFADAIADGWLVPLVGEIVIDSALDDLGTAKVRAGDYAQDELAEIMTRAPAVALVARALADKAGQRPTIVFTVSVDQAHATAALLNELRPGSARAVDGSAPDAEREQVRRGFLAGEFQFLCNCMLFTEGSDLPPAACIAIARPTKSKSLYVQMLGRGLRLLGQSLAESIAAGKSDCLVLDFCAASERIRRGSVTFLDVLDGNEDAEVRARAVKRASSGSAVAVQRVLDEVSAEILAEQRRRALVEVDYRTLAMADPFTILGVRPRAGKGGGRSATIRQLEQLARHKIPGAEVTLKAIKAGKEVAGALDYHQAAEILRAIDDRRRRGLGTPRQSVQLMRFGLNPDAPAAAASQAMAILSAHRWTRSPRVDALLAKVPGLAPAPLTRS